MAIEGSDRNGRQNKEGLNIVAAVVGACEESKGLNVAVLDVSKVFSLSDYFVIVSGRSDRHVQGIANKILSGLEQQKVRPLAVEGEDKAHWVLIDCKEVLVHVFYEPVRAHYDLESLWHNARKVDIAAEISPLEIARRAA